MKLEPIATCRYSVSIMSTTVETNVERLAAASANRQQFRTLWLNLVCEELQSVGGIIWSTGQRPFEMLTQVQTSDRQPIRMNISQEKHEQLLDQAARSREPLLIRSGDSARAVAEETTDALSRPPNDPGFPTLLISRIPGQRTNEIVELFLPEELPGDEGVKRGKRLAEFCHHASKFAGGLTDDPAAAASGLANQRPNSPPTSGAADQAPALAFTAVEIDQYAHQLHHSLSSEETARRVVNESRRMMDCERVTLMRIAGSHGRATARAIAISGQPSVNRRSNAVSRLESAVAKIVATDETFWYPPTQPTPPQIDRVLEKYLEHSNTRSMVVVPIFDAPEADTDREIDPKSKKASARKPRRIAALVFEDFEKQWDRDAVAPALEMVSRHAADAWRNNYLCRSMPGWSLMHRLGRLRDFLLLRHPSWTAIAAAAFTAIVLALCFVPARIEVSCDGLLMPSERRNVFANMDGIVRQVHVEHGDTVQRETPLLTLENIDLSQQIQTATGRTQELEELIRSIRTSMSGGQSDASDSSQQSIASLNAQLSSVRRERELLNQMQRNLTVASPLSGTVITWDVRDLLLDRPVQRTDVVMEVANLDGQWELELNLPDRMLGYVTRAFKRNEENSKASDGPVVEFVLGTNPGKTMRGHLVEIGGNTYVTPEQGEFLKARVKIDADQLETRQARAAVDARIDCGRCSLGYSLFYPVIDFIKSRILFPLF